MTNQSLRLFLLKKSQILLRKTLYQIVLRGDGKIGKIFNNNYTKLDSKKHNFVNLKVIETQPNIKGDTSSGGGKPATLETQLTITVPFAKGSEVKTLKIK